MEDKPTLKIGTDNLQELIGPNDLDKLQVGQRVISYDFPYIIDCYVEGIIREIKPWDGCPCGVNHIHIEVIEDVWNGELVKEDEMRKWVYPAGFDARGMWPPNRTASYIRVIK